MRTLTLIIPDNLDIDDKEISIMVAAQLYDKCKLTIGQAAELAGLSKQEMMDELGKWNVSIFGESLDDIDKDLGNE